MSRTAPSPSLARELGRLSEAIEHGKEDRHELKETVEKVVDKLDDLQNSVNAFGQTIQSMTTQVIRIDAEKCGARLDALEKTKASAIKYMILFAIIAIGGGNFSGLVSVLKGAFSALTPLP